MKADTTPREKELILTLKKTRLYLTDIVRQIDQAITEAEGKESHEHQRHA